MKNKIFLSALLLSLSSNLLINKNNYAEKYFTNPVPVALTTNSVADIAESAAPSVVSLEISINGVRPVSVDKQKVGNYYVPRIYVAEGIYKAGDGSGFIISNDGYIVTNYHVVNPPSAMDAKKKVKASKIDVILYDGKHYTAELVGEDEDSDLAVIKIKTNAPLKPIQWGDSSIIRAGDFAITIGSSLGADHTVGFGVISAVSRKKPNLGLSGSVKEALVGNLEYIQTYAQINPGNSGGPIINMKGEVIGIANFIEKAPHTPGFAIPSNYARELINTLIKDGVIKRPSLGIGLRPLADEKSYLNNLTAEVLDKKIMGCLVNEIFPNGPGQKAGLKEGDIIISFENKPIDTLAQYYEMIHQIRNRPVGSSFKMEAVRRGEKEKKSFTANSAFLPL